LGPPTFVFRIDRCLLYTTFQVWFIQDSGLFKVRFRQVLLYDM